MDSDNGNATRKDAGLVASMVDTILLTYNRATDHLEVGGKANSLDLMLDMLARATRAIEKEKRIADTKELQAALQRQAEETRIAAALRGRG